MHTEHLETSSSMYFDMPGQYMPVRALALDLSTPSDFRGQGATSADEVSRGATPYHQRI